MNFDTWVIGEYGTTITDPKILALMDSAWQAARRTVSGQEARMLAYELEGVVIDVEREEGGGFDAVCLNTVKRVRNALYDASKSNLAAPIPATK